MKLLQMAFFFYIIFSLKKYFILTKAINVVVFSFYSYTTIIVNKYVFLYISEQTVAADTLVH